MTGRRRVLLLGSEGTFSAIVTQWMDPEAPPQTTRGTAVNSWVLDGRFMRTSYEGEFNRDVQRYFLTTVWDRFPAEDGVLSLTADVWESDNQDTNSFGADYTHSLSERTELSLATYYSTYKFDSINVEEKEDVRTYSAAFEHELGDGLDLDLSYDYEDA